MPSTRFPTRRDEIAATAAQVRDPNFRVQVSAEGLHVYNRDGLRLGQGAFELWPQLGLGGRRGARVLHGRGTCARRDRLAPRQALRAGPAAGLGLRGRARAPKTSTPGARRARRCTKTRRAHDERPDLRDRGHHASLPTARLHVAPMGVRYHGELVVLMPFKPSTTLDNVAGQRPCGAQPRDRHARVRRLRDRPARLADGGRPSASPACAWPARSAMWNSSWPSSTTTRSARCCAWRACTR